MRPTHRRSLLVASLAAAACLVPGCSSSPRQSSTDWTRALNPPVQQPQQHAGGYMIAGDGLGHTIYPVHTEQPTVAAASEE